MSTLAKDFAAVFDRELGLLEEEIAAYRDDADLWTTIGAQKNAPATLAIHVVGGLNAMVGASLGNTGYIRDRDLEFSRRGVSRDDVIQMIRYCRDTIVPIIAGLDDDSLAGIHPGPVPPALKGITTQRFLMHLLWHVGWHRGHIYYHRLGIEAPPTT